MGWSKAFSWDTPSSKKYARDIANIDGLYCGPAAVGWIAAVWNIDVKGRPYDYISRLNSKRLFPDGPRKLFGKPRGFQRSLNDILRRETKGELGLSKTIYHKYGAIHRQLDKWHRPLIICMYPDKPTLHYVSLYKSNKKIRRWKFDKMKFFWQDNGLYGRKNKGNPGLYGTGYRNVGHSIFTFGAARILKKRGA